MPRQHGKFIGPAPENARHSRGPSGTRRGVDVAPDYEAHLEQIRRVSSEEYRPGHEQYTLFTWASFVDGRLPYTIEHRNVRRHVKSLAVLAVGYSGLPGDKQLRNSWELASVVAPVELAPDWNQYTGIPIGRTLSPRSYDARPAFDPDRESGWCESSAFLTEQLLSVFRVSGSGRPEQHQHVAGPAAVRHPRLVVNLAAAGVTPDASPVIPQYTPLEEIQDHDLLAAITPESVFYDIDSVGAFGYDVRRWTQDSRPLVPVYGMMPWFILPTNIRTVFADLGGVAAHWYLR